MRVLIATLGSIGDLMPFLAVAEALRQRKHDVIIGSNAGYAGLVQRAGFPFVALWNGNPAPIDDLLVQAPHQAWDAVRRELFVPAIEPTRSFIRDFGAGQNCTVLASWCVLAAPDVCRAMKIPLTRACLSPQAVSEAVAEQTTGPQQWLGFFPEWFGGQQPDWPQIALAGFPALDDSMVPPLDPALEAFLRAGSPPVIFTPGSFQRRSANFFQASLTACTALKQRAVFLTPYSDQIPADFPPDVLHRTYAPLSRLAARAAALVHHGGIGTAADGLRAGIPQLAVPLFFDQASNAERLRVLGVGRTLPARDYNASALQPMLAELLESQAVQQQCRRTRALFTGRNPVQSICDLVTASGSG